jgi:hypothetical protein
MNIEERVMKLERSARMWRFAFLGCLVLVGGLAMTAINEPSPLVGSSLMIEDPESDAFVEIGFRDFKDSRATVLSMSPETYPSDERFSVIVTDETTAIVGKGLELERDRFSWKGHLGKLKLRKSWLSFEDEFGVTRAAFGVYEERAMLELMDVTGLPVVMATSIPSPSEGDPDGEHTAGMVMVSESADRSTKSYVVPKQPAP